MFPIIVFGGLGLSLIVCSTVTVVGVVYNCRNERAPSTARTVAPVAAPIAGHSFHGPMSRETGLRAVTSVNVEIASMHSVSSGDMPVAMYAEESGNLPNATMPYEQHESGELPVAALPSV